MKDKRRKQRKRIKPKIVKEEKKQSAFKKSRKWIYVAIALVALLIPTTVLLYQNFNQTAKAKAAIIDQLRIFHPNETFKDEATRILKKKFETVDYYPEATVELYERLPSLGYRLIVWRAHSALGVKDATPQTWVAIATSEEYRPGKYRYEISKGQIAVCNLTQVGGGALYFGITPSFIRERMRERFSNDTVIILLSCNGLVYIAPEPEHAKALISKGVKTIISWNYWVNPVHNDNAGIILLQLLIEENRTIAQAVKEVPPDTSQEKIVSKMRYYPETSTVGNYRIPNYKTQKTFQNLNPNQALTSEETKPWFRKTPSAPDVSLSQSNKASPESSRLKAKNF
jgi:hypothetical protein